MKTLLLLLLFFLDPGQLSVIRTYTWYHSWPKTWTQAKKHCQSYRAIRYDLMTARTAEDLSVNMDWYQAYFGLHRPSSSQPWGWADGTTSEPVPAFYSEPHSTHGCATTQYQRSEAWSYDCRYVTFSFCQDARGIITFINKTGTWEAARDHCRRLDQELATLSLSSAEAPAQSKRSFSVWTGLHYSYDSWIWSNKLHSDYRNWAPGSDPGSRPAPGSCVAVSSQSRTMSVHSCSEAFPFLCQRHNVVLLQQGLSWEQALEQCRNHKSYIHQEFGLLRPFHLLSLEESELEFAVHQARGATTSKVWVGLQFLAGSWFWSDGAPVSLKSLPSCPEFLCGALDLNTSSIQPTACSQELNLLCYEEALK